MRLDRSMKTMRARGGIGCSMDLWKQPLGARREDNEERKMPGEHLPAGIDVGADALGDAEQDAAEKRAPQAAEAADDHGLEAENQPRRSDRWIKIGAHRDEHAGDRDDGERQRHAEREDVAVVEAHELRHRLVIGGGAERAPQRRAIEYELHAADHGDSEREL